MPWPETTVPRFGEWDGNEDLSYSIVFDKARADKERFINVLKNDSKESLPTEQRYYKTPGLIGGKGQPPMIAKRTPGLIGGKGQPPMIAKRNPETESRSSEVSTPKLSLRHNHQTANAQRTYRTVQGEQLDASDRGSVYSPSMASSDYQPMPGVSTSNSTSREMVACANGSNFHASHDGLHGKVQRVPGPVRQLRQEYPVKITRSQGCSETSSIADMSEKVNLPKFGDWDVSDAAAGDGFTFIFDRARDEKKSKVARKIPARLVSPLRPVEDLYKDSQAQNKKGGWRNWLCCVDTSE